MPDHDPVVVSNLRLRYPESGKVILHGVDLRLKRGDVKLLLGPSGAGKSSLTLTLNGLIPHQMEGEIRGQVLVNGRSTLEAEVSWLTSQVGLVFQDPDAQIATLSVEDEVAFGMENLKVPPAEMPERIAEALRRVDLQGFEGRSTEALSGGEKQRLVLASTLAMGASILVFDEPTANLDPAGTAEFFALLKRLKADGATILIIEHKLDELIEQVDSVAALGWNGTIVASGAPREIFERNADLLEELGVWVPQVVEMARAAQRCATRLAPFPITVDDAVRALDKALDAQRVRLAGRGYPADGRVAELPKENSPAVEVVNVHYSYPGGSMALRGASMRVGQGDFYAIVGPNGSGKTTLARHLIGLLKPVSGDVRIMERDLTRIGERELSELVAYVFQNPEHQFVTLTVYDELAFSLRARRVPDERIRQSVEPLLAEFGLEEHRNANPFTLSQGQKRRLSVATMLALEPKVLVLDEPTFGQDKENTARIVSHLERLNEGGITIIIITHDMKLVAECAHAVAVLVEGRVEYQGPVRELFANAGLLARANLEVPPLFEVSSRLRRRHPDFPLLMSVGEFSEAICGPSVTYPSPASSTA